MTAYTVYPPSDGDPLGDASDVAPSSQYWLTNNPDNTPLRTWAEAQEKDQATELGEVIHI